MTKLTRAEQDSILDVIAATYLHVCAEQGVLARDESTSENEVPKLRAALRLDDSYLEGIITAGFHKQPWQSAPDRMAQKL